MTTLIMAAKETRQVLDFSIFYTLYNILYMTDSALFC